MVAKLLPLAVGAAKLGGHLLATRAAEAQETHLDSVLTPPLTGPTPEGGGGRRGEEEGLSCSPSKAAVQARLAGKPQLAPVSLTGTPPGAVVQEACGIWVLVVVWLGGVTLTIIYILSHPSVKVM